MKIEKKQNKTTTFGELVFGQVFTLLSGVDYWMKCNMDSTNSVRLSDGHTIKMWMETLVVPVDATLMVEE